MQQLRTQQQLMSQMMEWQLQCSGQHSFGGPARYERPRDGALRSSSSRKRARSLSPMSSAPSSPRHFPRRRLSRSTPSPSTSSEDHDVHIEDGEDHSRAEEEENEHSRVVDELKQAENPSGNGEGDELEYIDVAPRRVNSNEGTLAEASVELDGVSIGDDDEDSVDPPLEATCAETTRTGQLQSNTSTTSSDDLPSNSLLLRLSSLPQSTSRTNCPVEPAHPGESSQRPLLDRIQGPVVQPPSLLDRLGGATWATPTTTRSRWLTPPNSVVNLARWGRVFDSDPGRNRKLLGRWCSRIRERVAGFVIPFPWRFERTQEGHGLVLVFHSPMEARQFVELWNEYAHYVPEAANLVAEVDVSTPFPRTCMNVDNDGPDVSECDNALGDHDIRVFSWNVGGKPEIVLQDSDMREEIQSYDVIMLQETHLYEGEHAPTLDGFNVFSRPRPTLDFDYPWGGVTTWVRKGRNCVVQEDMCAPDLLVLRVDGILFFNAYILPSNSRRDWRTWTDIHPFEALQDAVGLAVEMGIPCLVGGDLNARTESRAPDNDHPARFSVDSTADSRGRELLEFCSSTYLTVLNGSVGISGNHGGWTSHQKKTDRTSGQVHYACAVVDYMICDSNCRQWIRRFDVSNRTVWSDHSYLSLSLRIPGVGVTCLNQATKQKSQGGKPNFQLPRVTELDDMLAELMEKEPKSIDQKIEDIYGRVRLPDPNAREVCVYTDGSCIGDVNHRQAGSGLFYGHGSQLNRSYRVPGPQTNTRAELFAIYVAVLRAPAGRTLRIFTDSEFAIRSLTHWAPKRLACGWDCPHGDLLKEIVEAVRRRTAPLHLRWVKAHAGNAFNENADRLAKEGAKKPLPLEPLEAYLGGHGADRGVYATDKIPLGPTTPRVVTNLPPVTPPKQKAGSRDGSYSQKSHQGRAYRRQKQKQVLRKLLEASDDSCGQFWRLYKKLRYPTAQSPDVSMAQLMEVFIPRMNPPDPREKGFDDALLQNYKGKSAERPFQTPPSVFTGLNMRPSTKDVERVKAYLDARRHSDTKGVDGSVYSDLMEMDNEDICSLLDKCFETSGVPGAWLTTLITAIPKVGKDTSDPKNYRTIALESCFLKFATLLVQMKLTDAAEAAGLIPPSQNGFRKGFRTQNNGFILRSLIEKSRAAEETLFVAFVDISNAFPSTNQDVLWDRLEKYGMTGRYFDWLRAVYGQMKYMISVEGQLSPEFRALSGVLIGDPASPLLWNLFLAALALPEDVDDPDLNGVKIAHLEHADDMVIISRTAAGLQRHLDHLDSWCRDNFLELSPDKSKVMQFGPLLTKDCGFAGHFTMAGEVLELVKEYKYVGINFTSVERDIFERCYGEKARKARRSGCGIFGTDRLIGRRKLPPTIARTLYTALVDCHLIFGSDVIVDVGARGPSMLLDVQKQFLRRMLGLSKKSTLAGLFTETALLPLQYRRIILTLGYLVYLLKRAKEERENGLNPSYTSNALEENKQLRDSDKQCWLMDIDWVLQNLPGSEGNLRLPPSNLLTDEQVSDLKKRVSAIACQQLQYQLSSNSKLILLRDRLEPMDPGTEDKPPRCPYQTLQKCGYRRAGRINHSVVG